MLDPDLMFVVGWSQIAREPFLALAREGVFGMHPTLLPRHRGRAAIPWAILVRVARPGDAVRDRRRDRQTSANRRRGHRRDRSRRHGRDAVRAHLQCPRRADPRHVPRLLARSGARLGQDPSRASSWPKRTPADGIIDWETRAPSVCGWVRAQTRLCPGAFRFLGDSKVVDHGGLGRWNVNAASRPGGHDRRGGTGGGWSSLAAKARFCSRGSSSKRRLTVGARLG